jgi:hypothetical protein
LFSARARWEGTRIHAKRPEGGTEPVPAISLFFLHAEEGQSILVRFAPNRWIVIDSNKLPRERENPTCIFLREAMARPGFELLALVVTHLHVDHMSGIPEILDLFGRTEPAVDRLFLPVEHDLFRDVVDSCAEQHGRGYLRLFSDQLKQAGGPLQELLCPEFVHRERGRGLGPWLFAFHPREKLLLRQYLEEQRRPGAERGRSGGVLCDQESWFARNRNRFSAILGAGCGCSDASFHFLLTSDTTGKILGEVTKDLQGLLGRVNLDSLALGEIVPPGVPRRLIPLSGATVPHHGSGYMPLRYDDLDWWRGEAEKPPLAVVQGSDLAFGWEALEVFKDAGFRIWTSAPPRVLLSGARIAKEVPTAEFEARLPSSPDLSPSGRRFALHEVAADPSIVAEAPVPFLAVYGDEHGVQRAVAHDFYEVRTETHEVRHHRRSPIPV